MIACPLESFSQEQTKMTWDSVGHRKFLPSVLFIFSFPWYFRKSNYLTSLCILLTKRLSLKPLQIVLSGLVLYAVVTMLFSRISKDSLIVFQLSYIFPRRPVFSFPLFMLCSIILKAKKQGYSVD